MKLSQNKFADIHDSFVSEEKAQIVILPVPHENHGDESLTSNAPEAMLRMARSMSLYDPETDTEPYQNGIFLHSPLTGYDGPEAMADLVHKTTLKYIKSKKFVCLVGGDHAVSIGIIRAYLDQIEKLTVLQLDSRTNLHDRYMGSTCHANCAMHEASKRANLVQVGVRAMDIAEKVHMKRENVFFAHEIKKNPFWKEEAIERMTRDVYLSIDLSVFDSSVMPAVSMPEPGGLFWDETLKFIRKVNKRRNIVGFDIVGLEPNMADKASSLFMARLHHKVLTYIFKKKHKNND